MDESQPETHKSYYDSGLPFSRSRSWIDRCGLLRIFTRRRKKKLSLGYCTSLLTTWNFTPGDMGPLYFPLHALLLLLRIQGTGKKQEEEAETKKWSRREEDEGTEIAEKKSAHCTVFYYLECFSFFCVLFRAICGFWAVSGGSYHCCFWNLLGNGCAFSQLASFAVKPNVRECSRLDNSNRRSSFLFSLDLLVSYGVQQAAFALTYTHTHTHTLSPSLSLSLSLSLS